MFRLNRNVLRCVSHLRKAAGKPVQTAPVRFYTDETDVPLVIRPHFDYKFIVNNIDAIRESMISRNYPPLDLDNIVELARNRVDLQNEVFALRAYRNNIALRMQQINSKKPSMDPAPAMIGTIINEIDLSEATILDLVAEGKRMKAEISIVEDKLQEVEHVLERLVSKLPNLNHPDVPIGEESQAALLAHHNPSKATIDAFLSKGYVPRDHLDIAREHGLVDLEAAAKVTGSRFYYLMREAALLEMALINFSMQKLVSKGFIPVLSPDLSKTAVVEGAGFQSKDEKTLDQHIYQVQNSDLSLVATAEIPMAGRFLNEVIPEAQLPIKTVAFSHCFRTEAGRGGSQVKGLYRVHQFSKVEMFVVCTPQQAEDLHQEIIEIEKEIFSDLGLNFRVLDMPTLDLGAPAFRKVDIEACMPGRALTLRRAAIANDMIKHGGKPDALKTMDHLLTTIEDVQGTEDAWGEISSASNCTDYQARRLNIRYKPEVAPEEGGTTRFAYTLNGTACAVPRMIIAILEQNQRADGTVEIPDILRPYMMGNMQIPFASRPF